MTSTWEWILSNEILISFNTWTYKNAPDSECESAVVVRKWQFDSPFDYPQLCRIGEIRNQVDVYRMAYQDFMQCVHSTSER